MNNNKLKQISITNLLEFKIAIPIWLVVIIVLLPIIAYADLVMFKQHSFLGYISICALELFFVYIGFLIASSTFKIKTSRKVN